MQAGNVEQRLGVVVIRQGHVKTVKHGIQVHQISHLTED